MEHQSGDSSSLFVLDNRKLIIAFALMILVCGVFFVIGFMEGKRQGALHASVVPAAQPDQGELSAAGLNDSAGLSAADDAKQSTEAKSLREKLDWFENVNKGEEEKAAQGIPAKSSQSAIPSSVSSKAPTAVSTPSAVKPKSTGANPKSTYSVQVGAFRFLREAETRATKLKEKNYQYVIERSGQPDNLFLLKVGKFASRADAVAMQIKLRKDGFQTFIKTNP